MPSRIVVALLSFFLLAPLNAAAQTGWDGDDFIVSMYGGGNISVYDADFSFKGTLDSNFPNAVGIAFNSSGQLVAASQGSEIRVYNSDGSLDFSFTDARIGSPIDLKIGPNDHIYVATQSANGVSEFDASGTFVRSHGTLNYDGLAILSTGVLWAGGDNQNGSIYVHDLADGSQLDVIALDNGQTNTETMFFDGATNTVLTYDTGGSSTAFERTTDGTLVRTFTGGPHTAFGISRGPNGDVLVVEYGTQIYRWQSDGTFVGTTTMPSASGAISLVWAGASTSSYSGGGASASCEGAAPAWDGDVSTGGDSNRYLHLTAACGFATVEFWNTNNLQLDGAFTSGDGGTTFSPASDYSFYTTGSCTVAEPGLSDCLGYSFTGTAGDEADDLWIRVSPLTPGNPANFFLAMTDAEDVTTNIDPVLEAVAHDVLPETVTLESAYPNPFNPSTRVAFSLPEAGAAHLAVYDLLGREVAVLATGRLEAGRFEVTWNGRDAAGLSVPSGVYLVRLQAAGHVRTQSVTLIK